MITASKNRSRCVNDPLAIRRAHLPLRLGGLGLRSAETGRLAAYPVLRAKHPRSIAETLQQAIVVAQGGPAPAPSVAALVHAAESLRAQGFQVPPWESLLGGQRPPAAPEPRTHGDTLRGWQRAAVACQDRTACESLLSDLDPASRALLLSQAGPGGPRAVTALPTAPEFRMPSECMRILLLRRLRAPLPHAPRRCRCGGALDVWGDHRTACPTAGVLGPRGAPLERAAARVCREAGARVANNVLLRDMNLDVSLADARHIEVLANGLPLYQGAQVAVDTTLVSPVSRDGTARARADREPGAAASDAARRKRQETYPEILAARRCKLVVVGLEVGGRLTAETVTFLRLLADARARAADCGPPRAKLASTDGRVCWRWRRSARTRRRSLSSPL